MFDQSQFQRDSQNDLLAELERAQDHAQGLLDSDDSELRLRARELVAESPHLEIRDGRVALAASTLAALGEERRSRFNRYLWEGGFFLVVLALGMALLGRILRQEAALRRRQENFLAAVSHELKSPIASLRLATESMARRELERSHQERWLERSLDDLDRLETLVSNLLESSRLESKRVELERVSLRLRPIVERTLDDLTRPGGRQRVDNRIAEATELIGDPIAIETIVRNLLDNALRATESGGEVWITAREEADRIVLTCADSGDGFDPREGDRLFDKFYRPGDELRRGRPGTGLGLYLVRRLAQLAGGGASAHSDGPGEGARFEVFWPRTSAERREARKDGR